MAIDYTEWVRRREAARNVAAGRVPDLSAYRGGIEVGYGEPAARIPVNAEGPVQARVVGNPDLMQKVRQATGGGGAGGPPTATRPGSLRAAWQGAKTGFQPWAAPLAAVELAQQAQGNVNAIERNLRGSGQATGNAFVDLGADVGRTLAGGRAQTPTGRWAEGLGAGLYNWWNSPSRVAPALAAAGRNVTNMMSEGGTIRPVGTAGSPGNAADWNADTARREAAAQEMRAKAAAAAAPERTVISAKGAVNPQLTAATEGWTPEQKARFAESQKMGAYSGGPGLSPEEAAKVSAERVASLDRATQAVRGLRAAQAGIPEELLNYAGGDLRRARNMASAYATAQMAGDARGGARGGSLRDMLALAKFQAEQGQMPTPFSKEGADYALAMSGGNPAMVPGMMEALSFAPPKTPQEATSQMAQAARVQQALPGVAPRDITNIQKVKPWYSWLPGDWNYYQYDTRYGRGYETPFGTNPFLDSLAADYRRR